jgi:hypothetical protein
MEEEIRLVSMNKDEAVVAERVTTYKRSDLASQITTTLQLISQTEQRDKQLSDIIQSAKQEQELLQSTLEELNYKISLYKALQEQFDKDYPITQDKPENTAKHEINDAQED